MIFFRNRLFVCILCLMLIFQPCVYAAGGVVSDSGAEAGKTPIVGAASNGIPVVDIVAPTRSGVSHNKYLDFNVDRQGLILNNSTELVKTDLAGYVFANPTLNGNPAGVILNEVTSTRQTDLNGHTEVAGQAADIVIANPNGISVNGAGFLNTPRVTLTTGVPEMNGGSLTRFRVDKGNISIVGDGLNAGQVDVFNIFSRAVELNADLHARELSLVLGRNEVEPDGSMFTALPSASERPEFSLDASALGAMYADRIRLIGTEAGVGVRVAGDMAASAGDLILTTRGRVELAGDVGASDDVTVQAVENFVVRGSVVAGSHLFVENENVLITDTGELVSGKSLSILSGILDNSGLLATAGAADLEIDEQLANRGGMIFSIGDLVIDGPNTDNTGLTVLNDAGLIETWDGDLAIKASHVINSSEEPVVAGEFYKTESGWYEIGTWRYNDIESGYKQFFLPSDSSRASIISGGNLGMTIDTLENQYGLVSAKGDMDLSGRVLINTGREATHWWGKSQERLHYYKKHHTFHKGCKTAWYGMPTLYFGFNTEIADSVYGTLEAGGSLAAEFSEKIDNGKQIKELLTAEPSMLPAGLRNLSGAEADVIPAWEMLFQQAPAGQPYLMETRPEFAQMDDFVNSGYLLERIGYTPEQTVPRLGDGFYETRLIRDEIVAATGRRYLSSDYEDEKEQLLALMDNAAGTAQELELEIGVALKPEQVEMLTHDIVWVVEKEVAGQKVLVPQLYLARVHDDNILNGAQIVADGDLDLFTGGMLENAGRIAATGDVSLSGKKISVHQGAVAAEGGLELQADKRITIAGGKVTGEGTRLISAGDVEVERLNQVHNYDWGHNTVVGKAAVVKSGGTLDLVAGEDVSVKGAVLAGEEVTLAAGGNVDVSAVEDSFKSAVGFEGGYEKIETVKQSGSRIEGKEISIAADNDIKVVASDITSENDLDLVADENLLIASAGEKQSRDFRLKQSSGFGSKTRYELEESTRQVGSSLSAGGDLVIMAGQKEDPAPAGQIDIIASDLSAGKDMGVIAAGQIGIGAAEERDISETYVKKSNALSRKESRNRNDRKSLKRSKVEVADNLVIRSDDDVNLVAADLQASEALVVAAGEDGSGSLNALAENELTEQLSYSRRSGIDIDFSDDFLSVASDQRHQHLTRRESSVSTDLSAGDELLMSAGTDVNLVGAVADSAGDVIVSAGRDANILNAVKREGDYEDYREEKLGVAVDIDKDSLGVFAGSEKEKNRVEADARLSVSGSIRAENDLVILAEQDINQVGSDLKSGQDVVLDAGGNIRSLAAEDVSNLYEYHEQLRVGFTAGVRHNFGSALDAMENIDDSGNLLTGASRTLAAVDAANNAIQPSFSMHAGVTGSKTESNASQSTARTSTIVAGRDVLANADQDIEMSGTAVVAGRDIELTGDDVRLLAATGSSYSTSRSKNFKAGLTIQKSQNSDGFSGGVSGTKSKFSEMATDITPVMLGAGQDILIDAEVGIEMEGAQLSAGKDMALQAGEELVIHAAEGGYTLDSKAEQFGVEVGISTPKKGASGIYVSANGGQDKLKRYNNQMLNAVLEAGNDMDILVGGDATIRGANLTSENINAGIGGDLLVASASDTGSTDGERWDAGVTVSVGGASGISGHYGETDGKKDWIETQTSIIAGDKVDIEVDAHTQLDAALIVSETGNLKLETETFAYSDHRGIDWEESYDIGFGYSGIGGGPANQQSSAGVDDTGSNWSVDGGYSNRDRRQIVRATIGDGEIIVRADAEGGADSTKGLNRDVAKAYEITRDESDGYEIYVSKSSLRKLPELTQMPDQALEAYSTLAKDAVDFLKKLFPEGLSAEEAQELGQAVFEGNAEKLQELSVKYKERGLSDDELQLVENYFAGTLTGMELMAALSEPSRNAIAVEIGLFFDGTSNNKYVDKPKGEETNVARLSELYRGDEDKYFTGVGTDGPIDYVACGLTGCGSLGKADEALDYLSLRYGELSPDGSMILVVDTAGYSRGAATDRTFVNEVIENGIPGVPDEMVYVRSELLFDTVGSMDVPGNDIDRGHDFTTPEEVGFVYHAVAENEYRDAFDLQSVQYADGSSPDNVYEESFPGSHADVGGGKAPGEQGKSNAMSLIPLEQAREYAYERGLPYAPIPEQYFVPDELDNVYQDYLRARNSYESNPTAQNRQVVEAAFSKLESGYLHDSRPIIKRLPFMEDTNRTVNYPNDRLRTSE